MKKLNLLTDFAFHLEKKDVVKQTLAYELVKHREPLIDKMKEKPSVNVASDADVRVVSPCINCAGLALTHPTWLQTGDVMGQRDEWENGTL